MIVYNKVYLSNFIFQKIFLIYIKNRINIKFLADDETIDDKKIF